MGQPGHLLACSPLDLGEHSKQEGKLEFILVHGLLSWESSHLSACLNGDVSGRTVSWGGGGDLQVGRPAGLGVYRRLRREAAAASIPAPFPLGLRRRVVAGAQALPEACKQAQLCSRANIPNLRTRDEKFKTQRWEACLGLHSD